MIDKATAKADRDSDGDGARPLKEGKHAGPDAIIDAGPEHRDVERNGAPATADMCDTDDTGLDSIVPRPCLYVQLRMRRGLSPQRLEDQADDLCR